MRSRLFSIFGLSLTFFFPLSSMAQEVYNMGCYDYFKAANLGGDARTIKESKLESISINFNGQGYAKCIINKNDYDWYVCGNLNLYSYADTLKDKNGNSFDLSFTPRSSDSGSPPEDTFEQFQAIGPDSYRQINTTIKYFKLGYGLDYPVSIKTLFVEEWKFTKPSF